MSGWDEFKQGWREAGERHQRLFSWTLGLTVIVTAALYAGGIMTAALYACGYRP